MDWIQHLLSFALVIGLLLATLWGLRKLQSGQGDRKSTRLNSSHVKRSRMPSSA